ncbi:hypothetical protein DFH08DRAFT_488635 [Mycena albidolilacea]|uniref:Uncharacterized protein n=1 Tax=Mycena albidolilacea TaxID=1033008 RepID=A0AAD7EB05_9AGAR|nr:hypothetical protein DFH08DRAFT_488635 [Mycena albidolilacea]
MFDRIHAIGDPRHPNFPQLFGVTESQLMKALIYHDALVPACQVLARCKSDLSRAYTLYHINRDMLQFQRSWRPKIQQWFCVPDQVYTEWVNVSTGHLCIELDHESQMKLLADPRWWPTNPNPLILHFPTFVHELSAWEYLDTNGIPIYDLGNGEMILDGWTRITLEDFEQYEGDACRIHHFACKIELKFLEDIQKWWLAQATQVLGEQSASEYSLATGVVFYVSIWFPPRDEFSLRGTFMADAPPKQLYLFLLNPRVDIQ